MKKIGEVQEVWRYPVKGMAGERLRTGRLDRQGLVGDRLWAVRDVVRQEIQSCKVRPELLRCSARINDTRPDRVEIEFPDGLRLDGADPEAQARVSRLIGHESTIEPRRPVSEAGFHRRHKADDHTWLAELKATFAREADEPLPEILDHLPAAAAEFVVIPGTFFLVARFHLVTTATLGWLKSVAPAADWATRRFRPNVVIDTGRDGRGLLEQAWIGQRIVLGEAALSCVGTTPRCAAIARAQAGLPADMSLLRTVVRQADQNVGVYAEPLESGDVREGDAVYVGDAHAG
ncbi:MAG: MOSC domain-containing protein [Comamonadaceae bacterium]|nr:MAG: MOSC domain-containing protein [Comamonadaceae bacterium]